MFVFFVCLQYMQRTEHSFYDIHLFVSSTEKVLLNISILIANNYISYRPVAFCVSPGNVVNKTMETEDDLRRFLKQKLRECFNIHYSNSSRATSWNDTATCPWVFDGYLCWPDTEAGTTISQNCPDFVEGFQHTNLAHKTCLGNGTWFRHPESDREWSNYTNCVDHEELIFRSSINTWYIRGYITSLVTLIVSLIIFMSFKTLWCTRIKIHIQLFISLSFTCIVWIIWYKFIVQNPDTIFEYPVSIIMAMSIFI